MSWSPLEPGGVVSWQVELGGDPRNWRVLGAEDGRSWDQILKQIARAFEGIRTRKGATVQDVSIRKPAEITIYFEYDEIDIDAEEAYDDSETALQAEIRELGNQSDGMQWALHGSIDDRSDIEFDFAIEEGFEDPRDRMASRVASRFLARR